MNQTGDEDDQRDRQTFRRLVLVLGLVSVFTALAVLAMAYRLYDAALRAQ